MYRALHLLAAVGVIALTAGSGCGPANSASNPTPADGPAPTPFAEDRLPKTGVPIDPKATPFDGPRAMVYLKQLCDIGPRISGTEGMKKQQELLIRHFEKHGGAVAKQTFEVKQTSRQNAIEMNNLIVSWFPDRKSRIILCCHYDTRPYADQEFERARWAKPFVSANDGTSGVAFLMELAHHMKDFPTTYGVDFVIFDGEEYVFTGPERVEDAYFIGSEHFASQYTANKAKLPYTYVAAVNFDLCMHDGARLAVEGHSWKESKELVNEIWRTAETVNAKTFKYERGFKRADDVLDDHVALQKAGIPAVDVIDFDYAHWHRLSDTPEKCSARQMTSVALVITTWLKAKK